MCTAISFKTKDCYFGRNLDLEYSYDETVTITPRNFSFDFGSGTVLKNHYAIIGMAYVVDNYPLYYDAVNEKGVAIAGLSFEGYAHYNNPEDGRDNVAAFELIPRILCQCADMEQVIDAVNNINITDVPFSRDLPPSPLHWMISHKGVSIVVEQTKDGLNVFENPVGVLTNNPTFDYHMFSLNNYMGLSPNQAANNFCGCLQLNEYSRGMGAIGLPGDLSSNSRFVRAVFTKLSSVCGTSESDSVSQFFHILGSVEQTRGCTRLDGDKYEITVYSSCCNADKGIYYYSTYGNRQISAVDMHRENLDGNELVCYPLHMNQQIQKQN